MKYLLTLFLLVAFYLIPFAQNQKLLDSLNTSIGLCVNGINKVNLQCGLAFELRNANIDSGLLVLDDALTLAQKLLYKPRVALMCNHKGVLSKNKTLLSESIDWYLQPLAIKKQPFDSLEMASSFNNLGKTYAMMINRVRSVYYCIQSWSIREGKKDTFGISALYKQYRPHLYRYERSL